MKKKILIFIFTIFAYSAINNIAKADSIILSNETITGKINYVLSGLVEIKTPDGLKNITRNSTEGVYEDIVITRLTKKKITGHIYYVDRNAVEISTPTGDIKLNKFNVKEIILTK